jgi:CheY-like chemotaxis protein
MYLVVDDSRIARKMVIKNLTQLVGETVKIIEAANGQEAIALYKEHKPTVCFMDLTMPVMDGFEAIKEICEFQEDAQIIVISADIQELSLKKAQENGAIGFIKKPISIDNLKNMLIELGLL